MNKLSILIALIGATLGGWSLGRTSGQVSGLRAVVATQEKRLTKLDQIVGDPMVLSPELIPKIIPAGARVLSFKDHGVFKIQYQDGRTQWFSGLFEADGSGGYKVLNPDGTQWHPASRSGEKAPSPNT